MLHGGIVFSNLVALFDVDTFAEVELVEHAELLEVLYELRR